MVSKARSRTLVLDSAAIFLLTSVLIFPLFRLKYLDNWGSIESTFIADARMLRENLPHPGWQPLWYCGTRFDYIYPPALRYGTALTALALRMTTARAYHLYVAVLYALGIAGVYWLAWAGSRSRTQAWLAAVLIALVSPSQLIMADFRRDGGDVPLRLHNLIAYGEGPHDSALALLGFALAASFFALKRWSPAALAASGALCAAVVANNFYGATALAIFFPILAWTIFLEVRRPAVWLRAAGIAAIAYGLCAFWLTPSYLRITTLNLRWVAQPASPWSGAIAAACVLIFYVITYLWARRAKVRAWPLFLWASAAFTALYVLSQYFLKFTFAGNGLRLAPELDLAVILLAVYGFAIAWKRPLLRIGVVLVLCAACYPAWRYVRHAWTIYPRANPETRCEYQLAKWMNDHLPGARGMPSGSTRFWYQAWFNNAESPGGSDQGMLNQLVAWADWEISQGEADLAIAWMRALAVEAVIVPDKTSQEVFREYPYPEKFQGLLPVIYDDHKGNVIYGLPHRFPGIGHIVERSSLIALHSPRGADDLEALERYVATIEQGPDAPMTLRWLGFDALDVTAGTAIGQAVLVQESFDPAWHAYTDGQSLRIDRDPMGFMLIETPVGTHTIHLRFQTPLENRIGWIVTGLTCVFLLSILWASAPGLPGRSQNPTTAC